MSTVSAAVGKEQQKQLQQQTPSSKPDIEKYSWLIRPCSVYKEELRVCQTRSYQKHHEFVSGARPDCSQWVEDHANCLRKDANPQAYEYLVLSEMRRRHARLKAITGNDVWEYRDQPPADWNAPLAKQPSAWYDAKILSSADEALDASFHQYGVLGPPSMGSKLSQCALL